MRRYDVPTAITFLFAGLGLGAVLAILFAPRPEEPEIEVESIAKVESPEQFADQDEQAYVSRAV